MNRARMGTRSAMKCDWEAELGRRTALFERLASLQPEIEKAIGLVGDALATGNKVLAFGNGGSAADAHHFVAELVGRYKRERAGVPALALSSDPSIVTAIANDYGYESLFARQIAAYGAKGDAAIALSTSGTSVNVVKGCAEAKARGLKVVALIGARPTPLAKSATVCIRVPSEDTALIQECHMAILHTIAKFVEEGLD